MDYAKMTPSLRESDRSIASNDDLGYVSAKRGRMKLAMRLTVGFLISAVGCERSNAGDQMAEKQIFQLSGDEYLREPPTTITEAEMRAKETFKHYTDNLISPDSVTCTTHVFEDTTKAISA
ncbi:hypothetical protein KKF91_03020 [Myxococcota bacterium]|nr:hypothetical protein [Myxococcota bacterium]